MRAKLLLRAVPVAVVLATTVAIAAPASAGSSSAGQASGTSCRDGGALYDPITDLAVNQSANSRGFGGNQAREPTLGDTAEEVPLSEQGKGGSGFSATVDVYFHVVTDGSTGAVTDTDVQKQIQVMNRGYSGQEGGFDTGLRFQLAAIDRTDNAEWFNAGPGTSAERAMKQALHRGDASDLNIYSTTAGAFLGWAYFPSTYKTKPWIDGIVIDWASMFRTSVVYKGAYDLGKTATHEAGHWFGLYHVFQGGCNHWGDYVEDTPPQLTATRGCPEGQDSCSEPGLDSIHNYMDYSYDSCYDEFTSGQAARMQDQWLYFRANGGTTTPGAA